MNCTRARLLLEEQIDGSLEHLAEAALAEHLRGCEDCALERDAMRALQAQLAEREAALAAAQERERQLRGPHRLYQCCPRASCLAHSSSAETLAPARC